jgi:hypothetical protein
MTTFSAADSALGYLYQVRVALLWSLRRARAGADFVVSLETLDDVMCCALAVRRPRASESALPRRFVSARNAPSLA